MYVWVESEGGWRGGVSEGGPSFLDPPSKILGHSYKF